MSEKPNCDVCREIAKEANREPLCSECLPVLLEENKEAIQIYFSVQSQVLTAGMSGEIIDLNHLAIHEAMKLYDVDDKISCFEKVRKIFFHFQEQRKGDVTEIKSDEDLKKIQEVNPLGG